MENDLDRSPLEMLARAASRPSISRETKRKLFESYDRFLAVLDDPEKRRALRELTESEMATSGVWREIREMSHDFDAGLIALFFGNDKDLRELTTQYGVF